MNAAIAVTKLQLRIMRNDPWFLLIMFGMPLVVMPLFKRTMGLSLIDSGFEGASGAEQVVPGQAVLFGLFVAGSVGFSLYREHGWKTWDRLRASAASSRSLLVGFGVPWVVILTVWQVALFIVGGAALGLRLNGGSPIAALIVIVAYAMCLIALMLLMAATFRTMQQMNAFQNVGAMLLGGLGGALVPLEQLPAFARVIAPISPGYWAMDGHRKIFLEAGGVTDVLVPAGVLVAAAIVLSFLATIRFRVDETKEFFA